jgi:hypothetical protein
MVCVVPIQKLFSQILQVDIINDGASSFHVIFLLEELIVYLKIYGSQINFQQFHDGSDLQDRQFCKCVIIVELISTDF